MGNCRVFTSFTGVAVLLKLKLLELLEVKAPALGA
jgi:hypothetical protein